MLITNFDDVKAFILESIKGTQFCENYSAICSAEDYPSLFAAGCGNYAWTYQAIMDSATIALIPEYEMNPYGVFTSNVTLTNPTNFLGCKNFTLDDEQAPPYPQELHFIENSVSTLNISENFKYIVYVMGSANLTLNLSGCASCKLYLFNDVTCIVTCDDSSSINIHTKNHTLLSVTASSESKVYLEETGFSTTLYTGSENSSGTLKTYAKSTLTYTVISPAIVEIEQNQKSIVTNASP